MILKINKACMHIIVGTLATLTSTDLVDIGAIMYKLHGQRRQIIYYMTVIPH